MNTRILNATRVNIHTVIETLSNNELVSLPTETVYGLAGNAFSEVALAKIFAAKERPLFDPLIVHISTQPEWSLKQLADMGYISCDEIPLEQQKQLENLMNYFWPGPLTLILPKHPAISDLVTGGLNTVALRVPSHPVAQQVLKALPFPLAAPSANRFGHISPTCAQDVYQELNGRVPYILDGGHCQLGIESTIISCHDQEFELLRPGALTRSEIRSMLKMNIKVAKHHPAEIKAPGMLKRHYAPSKTLCLLDKKFKLKNLPQGTYSVIWISKSLVTSDLHPQHAYFLSDDGDLNEVAKNLFKTLRVAEADDADFIVAQVPPKHSSGLGYAVLNRLSKAAG